MFSGVYNKPILPHCLLNWTELNQSIEFKKYTKPSQLNNICQAPNMTSRTGGSKKSSSDRMISVDLEEGTPLIYNDQSTTESGTIDSSIVDDPTQLKSKKVKRKVKRVRKKTVDHSPLIKYGSLVLLVAQLVGLVMLMRYSRTHSNGKDLYLSSTAVFCMEVR